MFRARHTEQTASDRIAQWVHHLNHLQADCRGQG